MRKLRFLFTGTGRCGTGYISEVMNSIDVPCGHEAIFNTWGCAKQVETHLEGKSHLVAEASWEAAFCLDHECLNEATIVHLVRHPKLVLESWMSCRMFTNAGNYLLYRTNAVPEMMDFDTNIEKLIYFCVKWNKIIEGNVSSRSKWMRHMIEDDVELLLDYLGLEYDPDSLFRDKTYNEHNWDHISVEMGDIPAQMRPLVLRWCEDYGYDWDDPPQREAEDGPDPYPPQVPPAPIIIAPVTIAPVIIAPVAEVVIKVVITTLDNLPLLKDQVSILQADPLIGEIVVVNNGSKDGTKEWLGGQESLIVINRENLGAGPGRNAGLDAAGEFDYILMLDGGIRPLINGVGVMLDYLDRHSKVDVVSPEIATCFTTDLEVAHRRLVEIDESTCFPQRALSSTAYALCRAKAWDGIRFCEEGPFGQPGWGTDDNEMQMQWNKHNILHHDFAGTLLYRRASGSFQRLFQETGIWPNQFGSVHEQRNVWCQQNHWEYFDLLWQTNRIIISVVLLAWDEYPLIAEAIKVIHEDLKEIPHEVILVNNGSKDKTNWWLDTFALRWHHGTAAIDAETGKILQRNEENESIWTGDVKRIDFPENVGAGRGYTAGLDAALGEYIFLMDGDIIPAPGSVIGLKKFIDEHEEVDYVAVNPWLQEEEFEFNGYEGAEWYGMGNYGYNFSIFKREILDAGIRYPVIGPFAEAGCGYDDVEFVNQMYLNGFKCYVINTPAYHHKRRDLQRTGHADPNRSLGERKTWLNTRWPGQDYGIYYYNDQPHPRHIRRVAVLGYGCDNVSDISLELTNNLKEICHAECFHLPDHIKVGDRDNPIEPVPGEWDNYILVAGGNWDRWEVPDWCHPSIYWAIDMYYPGGKHSWPQAEPVIQLSRASKADEVYCAHKNAVEFYKDNGIEAKWLPACANPMQEHPLDVERTWDWTAFWHHCGQRIDYVEHIVKHFPNGFCSFKFKEQWVKWVNRGKCTLNVARLGELNFRPFEVMAAGIPLITSRVVEIDDFFVENNHYLGISTPEETVEQIRWVLEHPVEAQAMADRARELVLAEHTFYHRILTMLGTSC